MAFNPLDEKGIPLERQVRNWTEMNPQPYDKMAVHPYTRARVILMNGIEVESALFLHEMARNTTDMELKRALAMARRMEQQQEKVVNWLVPADESNLEVTLGYEQVAVDLTSCLARSEPDPMVKAALDFALLEDFDHLYRYANLYTLDYGLSAERIIGDLTEVMPGRPTIDEHRHPFDDLRSPIDKNTADILTKLHILTIVSGEQQTMNLYMTMGNRYPNPLGRGLYAEIAQIEEQHVTHYESLNDPTMTWFERLLLHDYNEAYLYYSCMDSEVDPRIKAIWEVHLQMEIAHIHSDLELMRRYEDRDGREMLPGEFPELTVFQSNKEYVRQVLSTQTHLVANGTEYVPVSELSKDHRYFEFQGMVNDSGAIVPSQQVIDRTVLQTGADYRLETEGEHPVQALRQQGKATRVAGAGASGR